MKKQLIIQNILIVLLLIASQLTKAQENTRSFTPLANKIIVGYWHNWDYYTAPFMYLNQVNTKYNVVNVSFIETEGLDGYSAYFTPSAAYYANDAAFVADVQELKDKGTAVLISIGGQNGHVELETTAQKDTFVNRIINIVETYGFDGIDLDFEGGSMNFGGLPTSFEYAQITLPKLKNLIDAIHEISQHFGNDFIISTAPEVYYVQVGYSTYTGTAGAWLAVLDNIRNDLDYIHAQLYNTGSVIALDGQAYSQATSDFLVSMTDMLLTGFNTSTGIHFAALQQEQVALGIPACPDAAPAGGYLQTSKVIKALDYLQYGTDFAGRNYTAHGVYPNLRGVMTWSVNWDASDACASEYEFAKTYHHYFYGTDINIKITSHSHNQIDTILNLSSTNFTGYANHPDGIASVNFIIDGQSVSATNTSDSIWTAQYTPSTYGNKSLIMEAHCSNGLVQSDEVEVFYKCTSNCIPSVTITYPANNEAILQTSLSNIVLKANAFDADGALSDFHFRSSDNIISATNVGGNIYHGNWTAPNFGIYTVWAIASDGQGNTDSTSVNFEVADNSDCGAPAWNASTTYSTAETVVTHIGSAWKNKWYANPGEEPGANQVWEHIMDCIPTQSKTIEKNDIIIYPNPAKEYVNIKGNNISEIIIYNINSQIIYKNNIIDDNISIDLKHYNKGVYIIKIVSKDNIIINKLIKN